ncbi:MAG TPA: peptidoglycan DD-metalloendopeptidase family protein [Terriglobia bacterium]
MGVSGRKSGLIWSLLIAVFITVVPRYWDYKIDSIPPLLTLPPVPAVPKTEVVEDTIHKNTTLVATLVDYDVSAQIATEVADLVKPVFDLRKLRFGNAFRLEKEIDGTLKAFEYKIDDESVLKVHKATDSYEAKVEKLDLETREKTITAEIHTSLWEALGDLPKREYLATELAEMFQWEVDFSNEIQPGDQIRLIVEESLHDGNFVKYGRVEAAELVNSGRRYRGYLFSDSYYDEKGVSLKRAILASPLKFTPRITSGFTSRRMHPILGVERAHLATDYGAPTGSPVVSVANGTVTFAGWDSGYGNLVRIKHAGGLTSGYGHLSKIAAGVQPGHAIKQGELVGLVGQTGLATGPHLHFMMAKNGTPINPVPSLKKGEPALPIEGSIKAEFAKSIVPVQAKLDALDSNSPALTAARR